MAEHKDAAAAAGADDHLGKPFRAEALIEAVARAVQGERESLRQRESASPEACAMPRCSANS